jgi:hypothetical protein
VIEEEERIGTKKRWKGEGRVGESKEGRKEN